jgi:hypothetical protein
MSLKTGWLNLYGGGALDEQIQHVFSRQAETKARRAFEALEARLLADFDGRPWLGQKGFTQIAVGVEIRPPRRQRQRKTVTVDGPCLMVDMSCVYPEMETDSQAEVEARLESIVIEAFAVAADRKELGPLPVHGQAGVLQQTPVRSAGSELLFYYDEPGDCYIVARQLPQTDDPSEISAAIDRYEDEILWLLSDEALSGGVDAETTPTEVRWIIPVPPRDDEDET